MVNIIINNKIPLKYDTGRMQRFIRFIYFVHFLNKIQSKLYCNCILLVDEGILILEKDPLKTSETLEKEMQELIKFLKESGSWYSIFLYNYYIQGQYLCCQDVVNNVTSKQMVNA